MSKTIEEYRAEVAARPFESHNEYRNRVGRQKRYAFLMSNKPKWWVRDEEKRAFNEACKEQEKIAQARLADIIANTPSFREVQIEYDEERGAYESRAFLEIVLRSLGEEPPDSVMKMRKTYNRIKGEIKALEDKQAEATLAELQEMERRASELTGVDWTDSDENDWGWFESPSMSVVDWDIYDDGYLTDALTEEE